MAGLISPAKAAEINERAKKRSQGGGNRLSPGVYDLKITNVEGNTTNAGHAAVIVTFQDTDEQHAPIKEWYVLGTEKGIGEEVLAQRLMSVDAELKAAKDLPDLVKQINKAMAGKVVRAVVHGNERIWKRTDDQGKDDWVLTLDPRIAWTGKEGEDLKFDASRAIKGLSVEEKALWDEYLARKDGKAAPKKKAVVTEEKADPIFPSEGGGEEGGGEEEEADEDDASGLFGR